MSKLYEEYFKSFNPESAEAMGWMDGELARDKRFKTLLDIGVESGDHILDLGCGSAQLLNYIAENTKLNVTYTGIDTAKAPIEYAKNRYPQHSFIHGDIRDHDIKCDWVLVSGTFNLDIPREDTFAILTKAGKLATKGVASNFLHADIQDGDPAVYRYYRPKDVISYIDGNITVLEHNKCGLMREFVIYWRSNELE